MYSSTVGLIVLDLERLPRHENRAVENGMLEGKIITLLLERDFLHVLTVTCHLPVMFKSPYTVLIVLMSYLYVLLSLVWIFHLFKIMVIMLTSGETKLAETLNHSNPLYFLLCSWSEQATLVGS